MHGWRSHALEMRHVERMLDLTQIAQPSLQWLIKLAGGGTTNLLDPRRGQGGVSEGEGDAEVACGGEGEVPRVTRCRKAVLFSCATPVRSESRARYKGREVTSHTNESAHIDILYAPLHAACFRAHFYTCVPPLSRQTTPCAKHEMHG